MSDAILAGGLSRSLFFVPGRDERKLEKSQGIDADVLLLDLEDSVSLDEKDQARELVCRALAKGAFGNSLAAVRINPPGTPYFEDDLAAAVESGAGAIMLPKSETVAGIVDVVERANAAVARTEDARPVPLLALVETALGMTQVNAIASASPQIAALCFGHADFSRDMGLPEASAAEGVLLHARCRLAIAARAARVTPIDTVYLDVRNESGFRQDTEHGASLGFEGRLCIHPVQVPIANEVFTPGLDEIDYAQRVIEAAAEATAQGLGVFTVDGKMVDEPVVAMQRVVLERARRAGQLPNAGEES